MKLFKDYKPDKLITMTETSNGIRFCIILTIIFIVLKLCKVIDWSWFYVLDPIWILLVDNAIDIIEYRRKKLIEDDLNN